MKHLVSIILAVSISESAMAVSLGNLGSGVAARDGATGSGYILFSPTNLSGRMSYYANQASQFVAVYYENGIWYYDNNTTLVAFTPLATDVLVASVDYSADTPAVLFNGQNTSINGIRAGYKNGDIGVTVNWWNGGSNDGEFTVTGTFLELNNLLPAPVTSYADGTLSYDYFAELGKVHFAQVSVDLNNWTFLDSVMEPGDNAYHSIGATTDSDKLFIRNVTFPSYSQNPESEDFDNDGYTNAVELLDLGTSPVSTSDTDADGLLDEWEIYHHGDLSLTASSNTDGDWLTALEEYQQGRSPVVDDDADNDGWLDSETAKILNINLSDKYNVAADVQAWADEDGDGIANAAEIAAGTDPFDANDPVTVTYTPLVDLNAADFSAQSDGSFVVSWSNAGSLGDTFFPSGSSPTVATHLSVKCVKFAAGNEDWLKGGRQVVQATGSGSRTVVAWVYNPDVVSTQGDVLVSWGGVAAGSAGRSLFSARVGSNTTSGALKLSGNGAGDQVWGNGVTPAQGQWSFVVFRYNFADGSMVAMQDFVAGVNTVPLSMNTGVLDSNDMPYHFIIGGDNDSAGLPSSQNTSLCIGRIQIYDCALPIDELVNLYNNDRVAYGKSSLTDTDSDGIPDIMETSIGTNLNETDSDSDGVSDGMELLKGTDPKDFYNGVAHYVEVVSGNTQSILQGEETPASIIFKVMDVGGNAIINAPVSLTIPTGGGEIRLDSSGSPLSTNLNVDTDANGEVKVLFKSTE